ncbi:MAG: hypothetical protein PHE56_09375, partial [Bacteroidales bacterium]|nr:hypothetical protein [Bacteroidales bacterium]
VEYYFSYNLLGEPEKFDLTVNQLYNNQLDFFVKYEKINDKYFPTQLTKKQEVIFTNSKDYKDIDYTLNSFTEFVLFDFNSECQDSAFSNEYLFYEEFYEYHKSKIIMDGIIPQFNDYIKIDFEENIR